jgi:hypothetical protein
MADKTWPGPPGCECDLTLPAKNRCTKSGWLRCNGAVNAMLEQRRKREAETKARAKEVSGG